MIKIDIINKSNNDLPKYSTSESAGMDLKAFLPGGKEILLPLERKLISTGIYIDLPIGYEAQIRPRSGLAYKNGVTVLNTPGTIDSDYYGEIKIILINLSNEDYIVKNGDRIAQMIINKHETVNLNNILFFTKTSERGSGGFGHTGI